MTIKSATEAPVASNDASLTAVKVKGLDATASGSNYVVTVDSVSAASTTTAHLALTPATGASVTKVEWSTDGSIWNDYTTGYTNTAAVNTDPNWTGSNLQFRVTVTAADGTTSRQYIVTVHYDATYVTLTVNNNDSTNAVLVTVGTETKLIAANDSVTFTVQQGMNYTWAVEKAGGGTVTIGTQTQCSVFTSQVMIQSGATAPSVALS